MNAGVPEIKPPKGKQYKVKQSRFKVLEGTNPCRDIVLGSSGQANMYG